MEHLTAPSSNHRAKSEPIKDGCFKTVQERLRYMAQVAKSDVMRFSLNNGATRIEQLEEINAELKTALQSAYRLIIRFEAHKGCMDAEQLADAEKQAETISEFGHGRWAGDTVYCNMDKIRSVLKDVSC